MTATRPRGALLAICLGLFPVALNTTAVNTALPAIGRDLDASVSSLQWAVGSYMLVCASLVIAGGALGDRYGRRFVFLVGGLGGFGVASVLVAVSTSEWMLVSARSLQGLGSAFIVPGTLAIANAAFPPERRAAVTGIWGAAMGLGFALGPLVGGILTDTIGWRWVWWLNVPVLLAAAFLTLRAVPESRASERERFDLTGLALVASGAFAFVLALDRGSAAGWASVGVVGLLVLSGLLFVGFVMLEPRRRHPLVHLATFRIPEFVASNVGTFIGTFVLIAMLFLFNLYLQSFLLLDLDPVTAGLYLVPMSLLMFVVSLDIGRITGKLGVKWIVGLAFLFQAVAMWFLGGAGAEATFGALLPWLLLMGLALGLSFAPEAGVGVRALPTERAGEASGVVNMSRYVGGALGVAVSASVAASVQLGRLRSLLPGRERLDERLDGIISGSSPDEAAAVAGLPAGSRRAFLEAAREASLAGYSTAMRLSAVLSLVAAVVWIVLVRSRAARARTS